MPKLEENDVGVNVHYIPIHLQPFYKRLNFKKKDFPIAEAYYDSAISIPLYPNISQAALNKVASTLCEAINFANES